MWTEQQKLDFKESLKINRQQNMKWFVVGDLYRKGQIDEKDVEEFSEIIRESFKNKKDTNIRKQSGRRNK